MLYLFSQGICCVSADLFRPSKWLNAPGMHRCIDADLSTYMMNLQGEPHEENDLQNMGRKTARKICGAGISNRISCMKAESN
jgi:hypothetical protein